MKIDISEYTDEICRAFDIHPNDVKQIVLTTNTATVTKYLRDDHGQKYLGTNGQAATTVERFTITT